MIWSDNALILAQQPYGDQSLILTVLTRQHGKCKGLVKGGRQKNKLALHQIGNYVHIQWQARLEEQLGLFTLESEKNYSAIAMQNKESLLFLNVTCAMINACLSEKQNVEGLLGASLVLLEMMEHPRLWEELYLKWEISLLAELGFALDLTSCAATGQTGDLIYVSPKSGRAVSRDAGEPYKNKLFKLPYFLLVDEVKPRKADLLDGFTITTHFLEQCIFKPARKIIPDVRSRLIDRLK